MKTLKIMETLKEVRPVLSQVYVEKQKDVEEELFEVAYHIYNQYLNINLELSTYLGRKYEEFSFLGKLEKNETSDKVLLDYALKFKPLDYEYIKELETKMIETHKAVKQLQPYVAMLDEKIENSKNMKLGATYERAAAANQTVLLLMEEAEYMETHAKNFVTRQQKKHEHEM